MTWVGAPRAAAVARQEFAVPGPFLVILATLSAPSIASATMCSMWRGSWAKTGRCISPSTLSKSGVRSALRRELVQARSQQVGRSCLTPVVGSRRNAHVVSKTTGASRGVGLRPSLRNFGIDFHQIRAVSNSTCWCWQNIARNCKQVYDSCGHAPSRTWLDTDWYHLETFNQLTPIDLGDAESDPDESRGALLQLRLLRNLTLLQAWSRALIFCLERKSAAHVFANLVNRTDTTEFATQLQRAL